MKKLVSITLPGDPGVCIFAMTADKYGVASSKDVTVNFNGTKISGVSSWAILLKPGVKIDFRVLAAFENGYPAVVQSKDGKHIAFLYDPITWTGSSTEISNQVKNQSAMLKQLLKELK
jgi:hypothetical protein